MMRSFKSLGDWALGGILVAIVTLALVPVTVSPSNAQDSAEDEVRAMLEQMYRGALGANTAGFQLGAPLRVSRMGAPSSRQFEAVLPNVQLTNPDGSRIELGDIKLKITVLGEGRFDMSGELPEEIVFRELDGSVLARVSVRGHRFDGAYDADVHQFETLDWESGVWRASDSTGAEVLTVSSGNLSAKVEKTSPTRGDSIAKLELKDISISVDGNFLRYDRIAVGVEVRNTNFEGYDKLLEALAAEPAPDPSDPESFKAFSSMIFSSFGVLGDIDYLVRAEGLFGRFGPSLEQFSIESMEFGFGLDGFDDPTGSITLRYGHRGADLPLDNAPPGLVPHSVGLRLSFQGLPLRAMIQDLGEYFDLTLDEEPDPAAGLALSGSILGLLMGSQSLLSIEELTLESDVAALEGRGTVRPDPNGLAPVTGKGRITIHGLERLQRELLSDLTGDTLGYVAILGILIALGEEIEDERGRAFVYNLEMSPEGKLLINGQDFAPLIGALNSP